MPNAVLLHGTGGSDQDYFWFADTRDYLVAKGYDVWWPLLPNTEKPTREETLSFLQVNIDKLTRDTIVIGHSSSCALVLSLLETNDIHITQAILTAGFYKPLVKLPDSKLVLQEAYDFAAIKPRADEIILINSDNDPWGCTAQDAMPVASALEASLVVAHGHGHMGSTSYNQSYRQFDLLKRLIKLPRD